MTLADDIDRAQEREQFDRELALAAARRAPASTPDDGCCVECGEAIEPARIKALGGTQLCAHCARMQEARARMHGGKRG